MMALFSFSLIKKNEKAKTAISSCGSMIMKRHLKPPQREFFVLGIDRKNFSLSIGHVAKRHRAIVAACISSV